MRPKSHALTRALPWPSLLFAFMGMVITDAICIVQLALGLPSCLAVASAALLLSPQSMIVEPTGTFVVVDDISNAVVRVDPVTGEQTLVSGVNPDSGALLGDGPPLQSPQGIALEAAGTFVVVDDALAAVLRVDPATGTRTVVSGGRPPFQQATSLTYWPAAGLFLVADPSIALVRLTPTGETTLVGTLDHETAGLAFLNTLLYTTSSMDAQLRQIDPANATTLSSVPITVADTTVTGGSALVAHPLTGTLWAILQVATCTGDPTRTTFAGGPETEACRQFAEDQFACERAWHVSGNGTAASCFFNAAEGACQGCGPNNEEAGLCTNTCMGAEGEMSSEPILATIDPATGVATRIGNPGIPFTALAFDANGLLYGIAGSESDTPQTLFTISLENAAATPVTMLQGSGMSEALAFNPVDGRLYRVTESGRSFFFEAIDLMQFLSVEIPFAAIIGSGPRLLAPKDLSVLADGQIAVVDADIGAILFVNPGTGDRTMIPLPQPSRIP